MWIFLCAIDSANLGGEGLGYEELDSPRNLGEILVSLLER